MSGFNITREKDVQAKTVEELYSELSNNDLLTIIDKFAYSGSDADILELKEELHIRGAKKLIPYIYSYLKLIKKDVEQYCTGSVLITPATYDEEGKLIKRAIYNIIPRTQVALISKLDTYIFGKNIGYIVSLMINLSFINKEGTVIGTYKTYLSTL